MTVSLRKQMDAHAHPHDALGLAHLSLTLAMWGGGLWLGTAYFGQVLPMLAGGALIAVSLGRMFAIQHDCGHLSYFSSRRVNTVIGVLLGAFTFHPYFAMRFNHNRHHAYLGNIDRMETHEVLTWSTRRWQEASPRERLGYRLYRSVPSILLFGPIFVFMIRYRWPRNVERVGYLDPLMQNALMVALWGGVWLWGGWQASLVQLAGTVSIMSFGTLMIYAGHNHEETYWQRDGDVDFEEAALRGSSVLTYGPIFDFATFNFAYHDLHHLNSRVPCYRLRACAKALEPQMSSTRMGITGALATLKWKLWDEETGRMIRFADVPEPAGVEDGEGHRA